MRIVVLIGSVFVLILSLLFIVSIEEKSTVPKVTARPIASVSVIEVEAKTHKANLYATVMLEAKEKIKMFSFLSGDIVFRSEKLIEGGMVNKGEKLLALESVEHVVALNEAKYRVDEAKYEYLKEDKRHKQALKDWRRLGTAKPSNLALNIPQRNFAKSNLVFAKSLLKQKEMNLKKTVVRSPFSGFIITNEVNTLLAVNQGDMLFEIASNRVLQGSIELSAREWNLLEKGWKKSQVNVERLKDKVQTTAQLIHGGMYLESNHYKLYFTLKDKTFRFGDFVKVSLPTKGISNSINIPLRAVTPNGLVWYVDDNNRLQNFTALEVIYQKKSAIVTLPLKSEVTYGDKWKIVTIPLSSFHRGIKVAPMVKSR